MKRNKILPLFVAGLMLNTSAHAIIRANKQVAADNSGPSMDYTPPSQTPAIEVKPSEVKMCNDGNKLALGLLKQIVPRFEDIKVSFEGKDQRSAKLVLPKYNTTCMKLKLQYHQVGNDIFISAVNEYNFDKKKYPQSTTNQKYEACLKDKGVVDSTGNIIDGAGEFVGGLVQSFPVSLDKKKDMNIHFASAKSLAEDYQDLTGSQFLDSSPADCLVGEEMAPGGFKLFKSPFVASIEHFEEICRGNDHQQIYNALKELRSTEAGNARLLDAEVRSILEKVLYEQLDKTVSTKGQEWDRKVEELGKELKKAKSEEDVKALAGEYVKLLEDIEKYVLMPQIEQATKLYDERKKTNDKERRRQIDKELKAINEEVGKYARKGDYVSNAVLNKMLEFGLKDEADSTFSFKLKSAHFAEINFGPQREGYPKDPKQIPRAVEAKLKQFEKTSTLKEREYGAKMGYDTYSKDYASAAQQLMQRREITLMQDQDRIKKKYQEISQYCRSTFWGGVKSKSKCQEAQQSYQRASSTAMKRYQRYNQDIMYNTSQASHFYEIEQKYASSLKVEDEGDFYEGYDEFSMYLDGNSSRGEYMDYSMAMGGMAMPGAQMMGNNGMPTYMANPYSYGSQTTYNGQQMMSPVPMISSPMSSGYSMPYGNSGAVYNFSR